MSAVYSSEARNVARLVAPVLQRKGNPQKAGLRKRIGSVGVLYAHALLIEHEAAQRYREFALNMAERGNEEVAALFRQLAEFGAEHAFHLAKKSAGMKLPKLAAGEHAWLDQEAPVPEAHAFVYRMLTPRMALEIALRAEVRAKAFFDKVLAESSDAGIREVARDLARDEEAHVAWVVEALARVPAPYQPSDDMPGDPTIPQQL
jgi:rubrerythrin